MSEKSGGIYILTNPSFPDYVKIGYADDIERRLQQLNRSECIPFAFRVYATYEVSSRLSDTKIHTIIDKLNPNLRSIDNFNGQKRVREFYAMSPEDAYSILEAIAEIHGCTDKLKLIPPKRLERNIVKMLKAVVQKQDIIEQRLNQLDPEPRQKFIDGPYRDVLFDNIISENQEQKVQDNINGYINLMGLENPNDDIIFTFFHTLSQMNELDIRVLKLYLPTYEKAEEDCENYLDVMRDEGIDESQYNFIREKLCRLLCRICIL